jgi:hypothetical protein
MKEGRTPLVSAPLSYSHCYRDCYRVRHRLCQRAALYSRTDTAGREAQRTMDAMSVIVGFAENPDRLFHRAPSTGQTFFIHG